MKKYCFFTCYDSVYQNTATSLIRSIRRFYPEAEIVTEIIPRTGEFDLKAFCDFHIHKELELLNEYSRVISIDADHVMCNYCPDLFGDYDFGFVRNNIPVGKNYGGIDTDIYINAGLTIATSKAVMQEWIDKYTEMCSEGWQELNEQNAINWIYHYRQSDYRFKLLEFPDKSYGISDNFIYDDIYLKNEELTMTNGKKICMFHAAGTEWKNKPDGKYNFNLIKDNNARKKIELLTEDLHY